MSSASSMGTGSHVATGGARAAARARLRVMLDASWMTQAAAVAVRLLIPDHLAHTPLAPDDLARATGCDLKAMERLLRALTSLDLVRQQADGTLALTETGMLLCREADGSLASWAELCGTVSWATWGRLIDSVRTGQTVRKLTSGMEGFEHLDADPGAAALFNHAMADLTRPIAEAFATIIDWNATRAVVDVGGGAGHLTATLLAANPHLRGVVFDLHHAAAMANDVMACAGVIDRCEFVSGSFFDADLGRAEAYVLKSILHNWDDERCAGILVNCRRAMSDRARLFVIERMMPLQYSNTVEDQQIARSDLNMLVGPGGCERTEIEYRQMLQASRLLPVRVIPLVDGFSVIEAVLHA